MVIAVRQVPSTQDPRFVVACIRACVWAEVEGRPFCRLKEPAPATASRPPRSGSAAAIAVRA